MNTILVSAKDFRRYFPKYQKLVEKGISLTILKRSKPIFRIEPMDKSFEEKITKSLWDYEERKEKTFVSYEEVFGKTK